MGVHSTWGPLDASRPLPRDPGGYLALILMKYIRNKCRTTRYDQLPAPSPRTARQPSDPLLAPRLALVWAATDGHRLPPVCLIIMGRDWSLVVGHIELFDTCFECISSISMPGNLQGRGGATWRRLTGPRSSGHQCVHSALHSGGKCSGKDQANHM